jgi:hypothetical protein
MKLQYRIDPEKNGCPFHRQLTITNIDWAIINNVAHIHCSIEFGSYNEDNEFTPLSQAMYPKYKIVLKLENTTLVNPLNGKQAIDGELEADCTFGEYDFFIMMLNNKIPLNTVLEDGINRSILRGRHNI